MSDFGGTERPAQEKASAVDRSANEQAGGSAPTVREKASEVGGTARHEAGKVAQETRTQAQDLFGRLRNEAGRQAHGQAHRLADNVRGLASELRRMSESGEPDSPAANLMRQAADTGTTVADRLEERGPEGLVSEVQDFARRRPGLFLAGAAVAGFAVSRLSKGVSAAGNGHTPGGDGARVHREPDESSRPIGREAGGPQAVSGGDPYEHREVPAGDPAMPPPPARPARPPQYPPSGLRREPPGGGV